MMGNSLGRAPLGGSESEAWTPWMDRKLWEIAWTKRKPWEIAWAERLGRERHAENAELLATGFSGQIPSIRLFRKIARPGLVKVSNPWAMGHA